MLVRTEERELVIVELQISQQVNKEEFGENTDVKFSTSLISELRLCSLIFCTLSSYFRSRVFPELGCLFTYRN